MSSPALPYTLQHVGEAVTINIETKKEKTSGYATWFTAGGAIRIAHYGVTDDLITVIDDVITRKL